MRNTPRRNTLDIALDVLRCYALAQDAERWITVKPNGEESKGRPVLIESETGEIKAGMGGKFTGRNIDDVPRGKNPHPVTEAKYQARQKRLAEKQAASSPSTQQQAGGGGRQLSETERRADDLINKYGISSYAAQDPDDDEPQAFTIKRLSQAMKDGAVKEIKGPLKDAIVARLKGPNARFQPPPQNTYSGDIPKGLVRTKYAYTIEEETPDSYKVINPAYREAKELYDKGGPREVRKNASQKAREAWDKDEEFSYLAKAATLAHEGRVVAVYPSDKEYGGFDAALDADSRFLALDRSSVRTVDENGYLHVRNSHITKATVNPYYGREIPGWREEGLNPDKVYQGFRDPEELKKSVPTWAGLPLHIEHHIDSAEDPQKLTRVGTVGTEIHWNEPYIDAPLTIWDQTAIDGIEDGSFRELSCAYRYDPDFTPGTWNGKRYDFVMRNIRGNHVALVEEGRAGSDVLVADARPAAMRRRNVLDVAFDVLRGYALAMDEERWITVKPNGEEGKGRPVLIEGSTGEIKAGMGGKFNGRNIDDVPRGKNPHPVTEAKYQARQQRERRKQAEALIDEHKFTYSKGPDGKETMRHARYGVTTGNYFDPEKNAQLRDTILEVLREREAAKSQGTAQPAPGPGPSPVARTSRPSIHPQAGERGNTATQTPTNARFVENMNAAQLEDEIRKKQDAIARAQGRMNQNSESAEAKARMEAFPLGAGGSGWTAVRKRQDDRRIQQETERSKRFTEAYGQKQNLEKELEVLQKARQEVGETGKTQKQLKQQDERQTKSTKTERKWTQTQKAQREGASYRPKIISSGDYEIHGGSGLYRVFHKGEPVGQTDSLSKAKGFVDWHEQKNSVYQAQLQRGKGKDSALDGAIGGQKHQKREGLMSRFMKWFRGAQDGDPAVEKKEVDLAQAIIDLHRKDPVTGEIRDDVSEDADKAAEVRVLVERLKGKIPPEDYERLFSAIAALAAEEEAQDEEGQLMFEETKGRKEEERENIHADAMRAAGCDAEDPDEARAFAGGVKYGEELERNPAEREKLDREHESEGMRRAMDACGVDAENPSETKAFAEGVKYGEENARQKAEDEDPEDEDKPVGDEDKNAMIDKILAAVPDLTDEQKKKIADTLSDLAYSPATGDDELEKKVEGAADRAFRKRRFLGATDAARIRAQATSDAMARMRDIAEACRVVRPLVGEMDSLAFDSANDVYGYTLEQMGKRPRKYDRKAWRGMVEMLLDNHAALAVDTALRAREAKRIPDAGPFRYLKNITVG